MKWLKVSKLAFVVAGIGLMLGTAPLLTGCTATPDDELSQIAYENLQKKTGCDFIINMRTVSFDLNVMKERIFGAYALISGNDQLKKMLDNWYMNRNGEGNVLTIAKSKVIYPENLKAAKLKGFIIISWDENTYDRQGKLITTVPMQAKLTIHRINPAIYSGNDYYNPTGFKLENIEIINQSEHLVFPVGKPQIKVEDVTPDRDPDEEDPDIEIKPVASPAAAEMAAQKDLELEIKEPENKFAPVTPVLVGDELAAQNKPVTQVITLNEEFTPAVVKAPSEVQEPIKETVKPAQKKVEPIKAESVAPKVEPVNSGVPENYDQGFKLGEREGGWIRERSTSVVENTAPLNKPEVIEKSADNLPPISDEMMERGTQLNNQAEFGGYTPPAAKSEIFVNKAQDLNNQTQKAVEDLKSSREFDPDLWDTDQADPLLPAINIKY